MAMENDPPLTEAEEKALDEYERLTCVAYESLSPDHAAARVEEAKAAAVAAIRAAHEGRVREDERERVLREASALANEPHYLGAPLLSRGGYDRSAVVVHREWYERLIAALRGEGAR